MQSHNKPMRPTLRRLSVWLATTSLTLAALLPAHAQPAPPPGADQGAEQAGEPDTNPPALAGRLANITGSVSFHAAGETQWSAATLNYPVTNGEAFWTEPQAQAGLEIADDSVVLDSSTELDIGAIDVTQIVATEAQGAVFIHLNSLQPNQTVTFNTPRGAVQITAPGRYEIVAGDTNDATMVTVVEGAAHIAGTNLSLDVGPQQTATIGGTDTLQGSVGAIQQDAFLESMLRVPAPRHYAVAPPPQVRYMTGAADLDTYGSYTQTAQYGQVWYPHDVARDWAPYRDGHWAYVQPWGWTWVDNARWGFAPFHYGRWVQVNDRWGWVPGGGEEGSGVAVGVSSYPVYSPALVSFVGVGVGVSIGFGGGGYSPAWIPLGPREPYYPWYHSRGDYFERLNRPYGVPQTILQRGPTFNSYNNVNIRNTTIVNNTTINRQVFINQRAATVVPAAAFTGGRSLVGIARPVPVAALEHARPFVGRMPVAPSAQTPNLPPAAARRYDIALPAHPVGRVLPGPRIEAESLRPHGAPVLRQAAPPPGIRAVPASQVRAGAATPGAMRPGELRPGEARPGQAGLPGLRAPGGRPGQPGAVAPPRGAEPGRPGLPAEVGRPVAPGPTVVPRDHGALPTLRQPGARPGEMRPGTPEQARHPAGEPRRPGETLPGQPGVGLRPGAHAPAPRGEPARPQPRMEAARPEAPRPAPHAEAPRPVPHREAPRPEAVRPVPRSEAPRPAPRAEAPHPMPRVEAPRPAPRPEPRPAPHAEAPHPAPHPGPRKEEPKH